MITGLDQRNEPILIFNYRNPKPVGSLNDSGYTSGNSSNTTSRQVRTFLC